MLYILFVLVIVASKKSLTIKKNKCIHIISPIKNMSQ